MLLAQRLCNLYISIQEESKNGSSSLGENTFLENPENHIKDS